MIDGIIEDAFNAEIPVEEEVAPITKGFLKMKKVDFDTWNDVATVIANEHGSDCNPYTSCFPDKDGIHVWARVEDDFIKGLIISRADAISQGMEVE